MPRIITLTPNPTYDFAVDADFVEPDRKLRCKNPQSHPGGGGINVARAAARFGADVTAIITAGGLYGDAVVKLMNEEGVPTRAIHVEGETRIAFHVRDLGEDREFRFNLPGASMTEGEVAAMLNAISELAGDGDYVVGSGSLPGGGPADFWARAARKAKQAGARFVLDSINGLDAAIEEGFFLLRQNEHEYPALAGGALAWPGEVEAFAQQLAGGGKVERVVISHGGDGSIIASKERVARVGAVPVKAHSAVGAGDSFVAAMLVAMMRSESDENCIRYGMCAAAATRITPGSSLFKADDVDRFYEKARAAAADA